MSCLWTCLSLLFLAHFLQKSASVPAEVSLECNPTVEIVAGEDVTLNCNITTTANCIGDSYNWNNTRGEIPCDSSGLMENTCDWDNMTYVSLTIRNVMRDENYTILIRTDCEPVDSHIKLQVKQNPNSAQGKIGSPQQPEQTTNLHVTMSILTIFIALFGILYFLFRTKGGRKITGCFKKREEREENAMMEEDTKCEICV